MAIPSSQLRLYLGFLDELKEVQILAGAANIGGGLHLMGFTKGKVDLLDLLEKVEIDHQLICYGDPFTPRFVAHAFQVIPKTPVEALERTFHRQSEIEQKILEGAAACDDMNFEPPATLTLCSSSVKAIDGLPVVQHWFDSHK